MKKISQKLNFSSFVKNYLPEFTTYTMRKSDFTLKEKELIVAAVKRLAADISEIVINGIPTIDENLPLGRKRNMLLEINALNDKKQNNRRGRPKKEKVVIVAETKPEPQITPPAPVNTPPPAQSEEPKIQSGNIAPYRFAEKKPDPSVKRSVISW